MKNTFIECTTQKFELLLQTKQEDYAIELVEDIDQRVVYYYEDDGIKPFAKVLSYNLWDEEQSYGWVTKYYILDEGN